MKKQRPAFSLLYSHGVTVRGASLSVMPWVTAFVLLWGSDKPVFLWAARWPPWHSCAAQEGGRPRKAEWAR